MNDNETTTPETTPVRFALCLRNDGYPASLEVRKVYPVLPTSAKEAGFVRVIDESGEDYLYPADYFIVLELPQAASSTLLQAA